MSRTTLLSVKQVGAQLGLSSPTIYKLIREGKLRKIKIGAATRIPSTDVAALIRRSVVVPTNGDAPPSRARRAEEGKASALRST